MIVKRLIKKIRLLISGNIPHRQEKFFIGFIISSGRTGTKFFENLFSSNFQKGVVCHEPVPDLFTAGIDKYRNPGTTDANNSLRRARLWVPEKLAEKKAEFYIESNPNAVLLIDELIGLYPEMRIIFIVRDLKTYLLSAYNKSPDNSNTMFFYAENDHRARLTARDVAGDPFAEEWVHFSRLEKIAWWWQYTNRLIFDAAKKYPQALIVSYEEIFENHKPGVIESIIHHLKLKHYQTCTDQELLDGFKIKLNYNPVQVLDSFQDLPGHVVENINKITKTTRKLFNYSPL